MRDFLVMTVDIKQSTHLNSKEMAIVIEDINNILFYIKNIDGVLTTGFTTGDEFEVVLETPLILYDVIYLIRYMLSVEYRIGLGLGIIENPNISEPNQMWGSAFVRAREALTNAKKMNVEICFITYNNNFNNKINTVLNLLSFIRNKMTSKQKNLYDSFLYYQKFENVKLQTRFADIIKVSDAMISKTLKTIGYEEVSNSEKLVQDLITEFYEELTPLSSL
jgi:hypothetical protein